MVLEPVGIDPESKRPDSMSQTHDEDETERPTSRIRRQQLRTNLPIGFASGGLG